MITLQIYKLGEELIYFPGGFLITHLMSSICHQLFCEVQSSLYNIALPNEGWFAAMERGKYIGFYRISHDMRTMTAVIFDPDLDLKIYREGILINCIECDKPKKLEDFSKIIELVERTFPPQTNF